MSRGTPSVVLWSTWHLRCFKINQLIQKKWTFGHLVSSSMSLFMGKHRSKGVQLWKCRAWLIREDFTSIKAHHLILEILSTPYYSQIPCSEFLSSRFSIILGYALSSQLHLPLSFLSAMSLPLRASYLHIYPQKTLVNRQSLKLKRQTRKMQPFSRETCSSFRTWKYHQRKDI